MKATARLKVLYNYLVSGAVDDEAFDMDEWPHCAVGEASCLPALAKDGLELYDGDGEPIYGSKSGYAAIASFFGVPNADARRVFGPDGLGKPRSAQMVAKEIKGLLRS